MKTWCLALPVAKLLLIAGCSSAPEPQRVTIPCNHPHKAGGFVGLYSFTAGVLSVPPGSDQPDLVYYFDADDCVRGALIGHDDRPGYLFPLGQKSWNELAHFSRPSEDVQSVAGISPLTKDKEGLALWVKTSSCEHVLVRIARVQPASYGDLLSGEIPELELEWYRPQNHNAE